jgi:hypothetical protein
MTSVIHVGGRWVVERFVVALVYYYLQKDLSINRYLVIPDVVLAPYVNAGCLASS